MLSLSATASPAAGSFPALDFVQAPYTGWTRAHWVAVLARMTYGYALAAARGGSPARALYPDDRRGMPDRVDGLESFARMACGWAAWLSNPANPACLTWDGQSIDVEALLSQGLLEGTNPHSRATYWGDLGHMEQGLVESADIAAAVWLTRERVFNRLTPGEQARVLAWLGQVDGRGVYFDNWIMFPAMAQTVRLRLGQPAPLAELDSNLDRMAEFYRGDGWYVDGAGDEFELYNAWMFNGHYLMWAGIDGERRPDYRDRLLARSRSFLSGFLHFFAANGAYPAWGRSLVYRFAAAGCFQLAHGLGQPPAAPGLLRRLSSGCLRYFYERGLFDPQQHHLTNGFHGHFPTAGEPYISPGSVYWCSRGLHALSFDADDAFWTASEAPLPVEQGDFELVLPGPGFVVSGRKESGQVLLLNSRAGQEHDSAGYNYSAKYGKFAYSSHFPFNVAASRGAHVAGAYVPGSHAPDSMLSLTRDAGAFGHRGRTMAGSVAPGMMWTYFTELVDGEVQPVWVAVLLWGDRQVRLSRIQPTFPLAAYEAPAALGCAAAPLVRRRSDPQAGWEYAEAEGRAVAIGRLLGYDGQLASAPFLDQSNINLAFPYAEQPMVYETRPSPAARCLAAISLARPAAFDPAVEFAGVRVSAALDGSFRVSLADSEEAFVAVGPLLAAEAAVGGRVFRGEAVRYARLGSGGQSLCGLGPEQVDGVAEFSAPANFRLARGEAGRATLLTNTGVRFDQAWLGGRLRRVSVQTLDSGAAANGASDNVVDVTDACGAEAIPAALVREWRQRTQRELVTLHIEV